MGRCIERQRDEKISRWRDEELDEVIGRTLKMRGGDKGIPKIKLHRMSWNTFLFWNLFICLFDDFFVTACKQPNFQTP